MSPSHNRKPSSRTSQASAGSVSSIGMGNVGGQQPLPKKLEAKYISLRSHNASQERTKAAYDCIVYMLYCTQHDKIALNQVDGETYWFPFITRDGRTWKTAMNAGLQSLLEKREGDGTVVRAANTDDTNLYTLELFRLQSIDQSWSERWTQFVAIRHCTNTCEPGGSSANLVWLSATELINNCDGVFWGPEFRQHFTRFRNQPDDLYKLHVVEQSVDPVGHYLCNCNSTDLMGLLLYNITLDQLYELYDAFLWHSYPAHHMSLPSFRIFLLKMGFSAKDAGVKSMFSSSDETAPALTGAIFRACLHRPKRNDKIVGEYIDFHDLVYALMAMDPNTATEKPRIRFLFSLYDEDGNGTLSGSKLARFSSDVAYSGSNLPHSLSLSDFTSVIESYKGNYPAIEKLCRLPQSVFTVLVNAKAKASSELASNSAKVASSSSATNNKAKKRRERCLCPTCRVKKLDYSKHCVTINASGRCVEPKIILNCDNPTLRTDLRGLTRHSMECALNTNSIGNLFFDHIRAGRPLALEQAAEQQDFFDRFKDLCDQLAMFVKKERKIVKSQSPAVIVGDLNGHLSSLLSLENNYWKTMPILGDNLIFLGNYSGHNFNTTTSLEVLAYLFSLKYLSPNKVILLRGVQETKAFNERTLLVECRARLGEELGVTVWKLINEIFLQLPVVAIVNECIYCASSGIPKDSGRIRLENMFEGLTKDNILFEQVGKNTPDLTTDGAAGAHRGKDPLFKHNTQVPNAFTFSQVAFKDFLKVNQFHYMIRSNEAIGDGFRVNFGRKMITVVSDNLADGETVNKTAVVLVTHSRGRIQIEYFKVTPTTTQ